MISTDILKDNKNLLALKEVILCQGPTTRCLRCGTTIYKIKYSRVSTSETCILKDASQ